MLEHVDIAERSVVVLALRGYRETLGMSRSHTVKVGASEVNTREQIRRVDKMIDRFTNQWVYLSDAVIDKTKMYQVDVMTTPGWVTTLNQLQALTARAVIVREGLTVFGVDVNATSAMRQIVAELNAGQP